MFRGAAFGAGTEGPATVPFGSMFLEDTFGRSTRLPGWQFWVSAEPLPPGWDLSHFSSLTPWGGKHVRESTINRKVNFYNHFCAEWPTFTLVLGDFIILRKGSKRGLFYSATRSIFRQSLREKRGAQTSLQLPSNHCHRFLQVTFKENARSKCLPF